MRAHYTDRQTDLHRLLEFIKISLSQNARPVAVSLIMRSCLVLVLAALAATSALVITPAAPRALRAAPRAASPIMDGDGPMVGKCKWFR